VDLRQQEPRQEPADHPIDGDLLGDDEEVDVHGAGEDEQRDKQQHDGYLAAASCPQHRLPVVDEGEGEGGRQLDRRIAPGDRPAAVAAAAAQQDEAQDRHVVVPEDGLPAERAVGTARPADLPAARHPPYADVEEAADDGAQNEEQEHHDALERRDGEHRQLGSLR
jgi:hypothetical protein